MIVIAALTRLPLLARALKLTGALPTHEVSGATAASAGFTVLGSDHCKDEANPGSSDLTTSAR